MVQMENVLIVLKKDKLMQNIYHLINFYMIKNSNVEVNILKVVDVTIVFHLQWYDIKYNYRFHIKLKKIVKIMHHIQKQCVIIVYHHQYY